MESKFDFLNLQFFTKAAVYPGSIGTFRYRFQRTGWMNDGTIQVWVYENISFELAQRGSQPYRIWAGNHVREKKEGEAT